jgi:sortase A
VSHVQVESEFADIIAVDDIVTQRKAMHRELVILRVLASVLIGGAIILGSFSLVLRLYSSHEQAQLAEQSAQMVSGWPYPQAKKALAAARAYNRELAQSGQRVLGEAADPFADSSGQKDSAASQDKEYQSLLDAGDGVIGSVKVPKESINLPIFHGTSDDVLVKGAGHLYGTSLPAGGKSSHSVITGHRGLVESLMFTRIDEMEVGDDFYIDVMGETFGYKVDRISVIDPSDTDKLAITPGEDRVTLMTCTPYGINTHRLLVSGVRARIPQQVPYIQDAPKDVWMIALAVACCVLLIGWLALAVVNRMRHAPWQRIQHASSLPR